MDHKERTQELIDAINEGIEKNNSHGEALIEEIQKQLEEQRMSSEKHIEDIQKQIQEETKSAEEQIEFLHRSMEEYEKNRDERMQNLQEESEEFSRKIEVQVEGIQNHLDLVRENSEEHIERVHEVLEQRSEIAEQQIERIHEQMEEYIENAEEKLESLREQFEEDRETIKHHQEIINVRTDIGVEDQPIADRVQSLMENYDSDYGRQHAGVTISNTYTLNNVVILKYSGKLVPLHEVDEMYPREEWLQTLIEKGITIGNLREYCHFLNARDYLMRVKDKPDVWKSGILDIAPTDNWDTYQEAYINSLVKSD